MVEPCSPYLLKQSGVSCLCIKVEASPYFQASNWQPLVKFLQATGLCRQELRNLRVRDIFQDHGGRLLVHVKNGMG